MCPVIRIDDDVYEWLKNQAVPFADTPNSVLRRLVGIDRSGSAIPTNSDSTTGAAHGRRSPLAMGEELIKRWKIHAAQVRFHRSGNLYEVPKQFPAALADRNGYVVFQSKGDLRRAPQITLGKKLNVRGGISTMPGYQKVDDPIVGS
jgi:hypothetical protein